MKNKTAFLPESLNFQALWFLFRPFVKDYRLPLPLWFPSAVSPTKRETSSPRHLQVGKEFLCLGRWARGRGLCCKHRFHCSLGGLSQGLCSSFLCLLAWKKESKLHHGDPLQGKLCDLMNLWKRFHFSHLRMVLRHLSCA